MQYELSGIGWKSDIVDYMKSAMRGLSEANYINARNVGNIDLQYISLLSKGFKAPEIIERPGQYAVKWNRQDYTLASKIADNLNIPKIVVLNYFLAIYDLARAGKIDMSHYNPVEVKKSIKQKEKVLGKPAIKKIGSTLMTTFNMTPLLLLGGGAIALIYMANEYKKSA